jgi:DNA topoisomerase-3
VAKGKLCRTLEEQGRVLDRRSFEHALEALWREGLVLVEQETFEKDGRTIPFQRVHTSKEGARVGGARLLEVRVDDELRAGMGPGDRLKAVVRRRKEAARDEGAFIDDPGLDGVLVERLRAWRRDQAQARSVPAYRVLTNRALEGIARDRPNDLEGLEEVHGVGPRFVSEYGEELLALVAAKAG